MHTLLKVTIVGLILLARKEYNHSEQICLNPEEQKLYALIMEYRQSKNLQDIPFSSKLTKVAQLHAKDLSENYDRDNKKCNIHSWSKKGNWKPCCYTADHKQASCMWSKPSEIAGYPGNGYEISYYSSKGATAQEGLSGWKVSHGHNSVILNEGTWKNVNWKAIGIGIYKEYGVVWFGEVADNEVPGNCN